MFPGRENKINMIHYICTSEDENTGSPIEAEGKLPRSRALKERDWQEFLEN
jgi:hypothetical protein